MYPRCPNCMSQKHADFSVSYNEQEIHIIFSDHDKQDLDNEQMIFWVNCQNIFEDDEKFGDETNENIAQMVQSIVKKKNKR